MGKVLIVYHTLSGNTRAMAKAVAEGAKSVPGTDVDLKLALDTSLEDFVNCDAVAFGSADYFSYIAGALKDFFDRTLYPARDRVSGKPCAIFGTAGGSTEKVLGVLDRMCNAFRLKKIAEGVGASGKPSEIALEECKELGKKLAQAANQ